MKNTLLNQITIILLAMQVGALTISPISFWCMIVIIVVNIMAAVETFCGIKRAKNAYSAKGKI